MLNNLLYGDLWCLHKENNMGQAGWLHLPPMTKCPCILVVLQAVWLFPFTTPMLNNLLYVDLWCLYKEQVMGQAGWLCLPPMTKCPCILLVLQAVWLLTSPMLTKPLYVGLLSLYKQQLSLFWASFVGFLFTLSLICASYKS